MTKKAKEPKLKGPGYVDPPWDHVGTPLAVDLDRVGPRDWQARLERARRADARDGLNVGVAYDRAWREVKTEYHDRLAALEAARVPEPETE